MLDSYVRKPIDAFFARTEHLFRKIPLQANHITLAGALLIPAVVFSIAIGAFYWAFALIVLNRFLDALDGVIARLHGATDFGGFVDIVADFAFYASIPVAFALYDPAHNAVASCFLLLSFIGTSSSFLSYAIIAAKRNLQTSERGKKSFFHLGGLIEGSESIAFCLLICLLPEYYAVITWVFAGLCGLSTLGRIIMAYRSFT